MTPLLIAVAGGLGAMARQLVILTLNRPRSATWIVNLAGSAAAGACLGIHRDLAILTIGFLGGFTTFSTAAVDSTEVGQDSGFWQAVAHAIGMLLACSVMAGAVHTLTLILR